MSDSDHEEKPAQQGKWVGDKIDQAIALYDEAAVLQQQGTRNQYGQNGYAVSNAAGYVLESARALVQKISERTPATNSSDSSMPVAR